jgi:hypothetical protein
MAGSTKEKFCPIIARASGRCCERSCLGSFDSLEQDVKILKAADEEVRCMKRKEKRMYMK